MLLIGVLLPRWNFLRSFSCFQFFFLPPALKNLDKLQRTKFKSLKGILDAARMTWYSEVMDVNFLVKDELQDLSRGKVLKWALNWGKKIVVLTELVVILAFLSRFWLDTTVADLGEQITQKKSIVDASAESEKQFRLLSSRINKATQIENTVSILTIYDETENLIPDTIDVEQLTISRKDVAFGGSTDEETLSTMVNSFRNSKNFTNIRVEKISKQAGVGQKVNFSFKADYAYKQ